MSDLFPTNTQNVTVPPEATTPLQPAKFSFFKGGVDVIAPRDQEEFEWERGAAKVREQLRSVPIKFLAKSF